jgi:hypothetical protein
MLLLANRAGRMEVSELHGDITTITGSASAQRTGQR